MPAEKQTDEKRIGTGKAGPGRPKGVPNKANADLRAAAQEYTDAALQTLASIMWNVAQPAAARVAAANGILDRAHGKPVQAISGPDGGPIPVEDVTDALAKLSPADRAKLRALALKLEGS